LEISRLLEGHAIPRDLEIIENWIHGITGTRPAWVAA